MSLSKMQTIIHPCITSASTITRLIASELVCRLHLFSINTALLTSQLAGTALIQRSGNPKEYTSAKNRNNETAVHKACWNKKVRGFMLELLIKFDAPLDVKNHLGETPLHYAIRCVVYSTQKLLRIRQADQFCL